MRPHLLLICDRVPANAFEDFRRLVDVNGLEIEVREVNHAVDWLLPAAAAVLFISKAYFESFLKEMGKDHYALLKSGLKSLHARLIHIERPSAATLATQASPSPVLAYPSSFSLLAEGEGGLSFKMLFEREATQREYGAAVEAFLAFLDAYHGGKLDAVARAEIEDARLVNAELQLVFNASLDRVQPAGPQASEGAHGA